MRSNRSARNNKKRFDQMLSAKRARMTEREFHAWLSKHHARTDPYSYQGGARVEQKKTPEQQIAPEQPKWKHTAKVKYKRSAGILSGGSYLPEKKQRARFISKNRNCFHSSCRNLNAHHTDWVRSLRCY